MLLLWFFFYLKQVKSPSQLIMRMLRWSLSQYYERQCFHQNLFSCVCLCFAVDFISLCSHCASFAHTTPNRKKVHMETCFCFFSLWPNGKYVNKTVASKPLARNFFHFIDNISFTLRWLISGNFSAGKFKFTNKPVKFPKPTSTHYSMSWVCNRRNRQKIEMKWNITQIQWLCRLYRWEYEEQDIYYDNGNRKKYKPATNAFCTMCCLAEFLSRCSHHTRTWINMFLFFHHRVYSFCSIFGRSPCVCLCLLAWVFALFFLP